MQVRTRIANLWRPLFSKKQLEQDLNDELHSYLEEQIERRIRAGENPERARRDALVEFGGMEQAKDACRDIRRMRWREMIWHDFRYALRTIHRGRSVTAIALLSLALGIGANTLVFSFMNALLLRPLPYPEPDRLVLVRSVQRTDPRQTASLHRSNCNALQALNIFEGFGCYTDDSWASVGGNSSRQEPPERLPGLRFTAGLPRALAMSPLIGRWFTEAEEREGVDPVVLISYGLWQRRFGGTPDILGQTLHLDGEVASIIGVMSDEFEFINSNAEYWFPFRSPSAGLQSSARIANGIGRLKSGLDIQAAKAAVDSFALSLEEQSPGLNKGWAITLQSLNDAYLEPAYYTATLTLEGAVVFVLLIACANVAGLLLAQGITRQRELAVRTALGSGRWRLVRQSLMHSIVLGCLGGMLGLAAGSAGVQALRNTLPGGLPRAVYAVHLDGTIVVFTFGISLLCGLLSGNCSGDPDQPSAAAGCVTRIQPERHRRHLQAEATQRVCRRPDRSCVRTIDRGRRHD